LLEGEKSNNPITTLIKVQEVQRGQEAPHNGNAILPKDIQVAPFRPKGLIDIILNTRFMGGSQGIDGFPGGHPNLNSSHLGLMDNIVGRIMNIKMHLTSF
jgi:hypothetical protein